MLGNVERNGVRVRDAAQQKLLLWRAVEEGVVEVQHVPNSGIRLAPFRVGADLFEPRKHHGGQRPLLREAHLTQLFFLLLRQGIGEHRIGETRCNDRAVLVVVADKLTRDLS